MKKTLINGKKLLTLLTISHIINFICYLLTYTTNDIYEFYSIFTFIFAFIIVLVVIIQYMCYHWDDDDLIDNLKNRNK